MWRTNGCALRKPLNAVREIVLWSERKGYRIRGFRGIDRHKSPYYATKRERKERWGKVFSTSEIFRGEKTVRNASYKSVKNL